MTIDPATGTLPRCPRPGHENRRIARDGAYGAPPRQRYRCSSDDGTFHRFTPTTTTDPSSAAVSLASAVGLTSADIRHLNATDRRGRTNRPASHFTSTADEIATALFAVGSGSTYQHAARLADGVAGRSPSASGGDRVARWIDGLAPIILSAHADRHWPRELTLTSVRFVSRRSRNGRPRAAFTVLVVYGSRPSDPRGRVLALCARAGESTSDWVSVLTKAPRGAVVSLVHADATPDLLAALAEVWPDSQLRPVARAVLNTPATRSVPVGLVRTIRTVGDALATRSFVMHGSDRTNLALGLIRLHLNGDDSLRRYQSILERVIGGDPVLRSAPTTRDRRTAPGRG